MKMHNVLKMNVQPLCIDDLNCWRPNFPIVYSNPCYTSVYPSHWVKFSNWCGRWGLDPFHAAVSDSGFSSVSIWMLNWLTAWLKTQFVFQLDQVIELTETFLKHVGKASINTSKFNIKCEELNYLLLRLRISLLFGWYLSI